MTSRKIGLATVALTAAVALAGQAGAQSNSIPMLTGPTPAGVCSLNFGRALGESTAGRYLAQRLNELTSQVQAEIDAEKTGIQTDNDALVAQRSTLSSDQLQTRAQAIQTRANALQHKVQQREAEMQATQNKGVQTIEVTLYPIVQSTATEKHCTLLVSTEALVLPNPSIDITDSVIAGLNTKLTQFPIDRVHLDQGAPAAGQ